MNNQLERVNPAEVGLSGNAILNYLEKLQACGTEMHGLMIARQGKICAEGWWKPYSPGLIHTLASLTKSYVVTAMGILVFEGRVSVDEKIIDILSEYMPEHISDNLRALTIHHMLCMGAGNDTMQDRTRPGWLHDFFASDFANPPGSRFYYSGVITSVLGAVIRKKTSLGLMEYLKPRLFDKIGIDAGRLKWIEHPDGLEYGGGGLFARTEDNLRLGQLYLNGGIWNGERIISKEWVKAASSKQIDNDNEKPADNRVGYGYQMWMCRPSGVYRFDGAKGQFVIVVPRLDMVIAINQMSEQPVTQKTLDITWEYLEEAEGSDSGDARLAAMMKSLSLPRTESGGTPPQDRFTKDRTFQFDENDISLFPGDLRMLSYKTPLGIEQIGFSEKRGEIIAEIRSDGRLFLLHISLDGIDRLSNFHVADDLPEMVYASGLWMDDNTLQVTLRYLETPFTVPVVIKRHQNGIELSTSPERLPQALFPEARPVKDTRIFSV
ncbi:MAG: serine hydrolase [Dehalococcoidales bacterium]|nr:serine hydrolase [Dehalococcoidales bacterium]